LRAREPDAAGYAERDGVKLHWELFGAGDTTVVLLPTWSIIHSRIWKAQIPYLARHFRVVTFDGRGCGCSDRPDAAAAYSDAEYTADTVAVLGATETADAVLVGFSRGTVWGVRTAAESPERVRGLVCLGANAVLAGKRPHRVEYAFGDRLNSTTGWKKYNRHYWLEGGYLDFVEFFARQVCTESHSTKQIEDFVDWALDVEPATLVATNDGAGSADPERVRDLRARVRAPVLVVHGDEDAISPISTGVALAAATGGELVTIAGGGHLLPTRHPVVVNRLIKCFVDRVAR
jgi:pimeloyl-ACP methyl ester carboxylesterase